MRQPFQDQNGIFSQPPGYWHIFLPARLPPGRLNLLLDRRAALANLGLLFTLLMCAVASLSFGTVTLSAHQVLLALSGEGAPMHRFVIEELRLPRLVSAVLTGVAFALSGCLMQTLARNRLATPGIIGIDNAATAFAVASVVGTGISVAPPMMALTGAATATALAFGLAGRSGTQGYRFIITGLGIGAIAGAMTQLMLSRVAIDDANAAYPWTVGSLNARDPFAVQLLAGGLMLAWPLCLLLGRGLGTLQFPDAVAIGLGRRPGHIRSGGLVLSVLLTGLAVAVAGPVGMVALIAPEFARALNRPGYVPLLGAGLTGAIIMVLADLAGRVMLSPLEVPVGIVTALAGSPYLLWILLKRPSGKLG
ncbi:FecCD family ABC transporter permease [Hydrocarboniclastica marina]|uniref:Iron ABC transporter permease n=1 Tax=Hydrocarboniclastica marina TaxID=2259620 RepID=A0A4P7XLS9_9ALTE|nr:iron ABC transporter permease [Hydrocarboniclastica marina]MAM00210.1 ABC transporter permease [Alteromonadaceae bacterium]QCF27544.1 iron ABC transporter permease [Hydrocarboniclastica marina]